MNPIIRSAHTLRFRVAALVGGLCLVLASCQHSPTPPKDQKLYYLATGSPSGTYLLLGAAIAAETPATHLMPCTTAGSKENLELLRQGTVQFALVQMDSLHEELFGDAGESIRPERPNSQGQKNDAQDGTNQIEPSPISLMTFLYSEKVHLFVRPHYYLNSLSDLRRIRSSKDRRSNRLRKNLVRRVF
jgi:TRAP-type uncharacterized transport system substrate-binding protein